MKKYILLPLLLLSTAFACAQSDSVTLVNAKWSEKEIANGVIYKSVHFNNQELFKSNQFISIIEVGSNSGARLEIFPSPVLKETSKMAEEMGADAAINGSFFKFNYAYNTEDYNSVDYIRKDNKRLAPNTITETNQRQMHQLGALAIHNGELYILKSDELKSWENYIFAQEILTTGPILRVAGRDEKLQNASFYTTRHPRTAVAKKRDGTIMLVTIDGRAKESAGVSLTELQSILRWLGGEYIINLDGGGSTTMYIKGFSDNGVVNHPTDNKVFDNKGERKVANMVLLYLRK
ncbi:MAG: phosphodiester glycosidase family protein [Bacteroidales bacterium]|jgi:exopolysaccharide biosynthesis protein